MGELLIFIGGVVAGYLAGQSDREERDRLRAALAKAEERAAVAEAEAEIAGEVAEAAQTMAEDLDADLRSRRPRY